MFFWCAGINPFGIFEKIKNHHRRIKIGISLKTGREKISIIFAYV